MGDSKFDVSRSNDGKTWVIKRPLEQVYVDVWDTSPPGFEMAHRIADLLNEYNIPDWGKKS